MRGDVIIKKKNIIYIMLVILKNLRPFLATHLLFINYLVHIGMLIHVVLVYLDSRGLYSTWSFILVL